MSTHLHVRPVLEKVPIKQAVHVVAPIDTATMPGEHATHVAEGTVEYVPARHDVQESEPMAETER